VDAPALDAPLSAHLSWGSDEVDLDLVVVPPSGRVGALACRAGTSAAFCSFPTGDVRALGPEAAHISQLTDGAWGVVVMVLPAEGAATPAAVSITSRGETLWLAGPRVLSAQGPDAWLVARVVVTAGTPRIEPINRVQQGPPTATPDEW